MAKPPFKANPADVILCPRLKREVPLDAYCHGWALRDELCKYAEWCPTYLSVLISRIRAKEHVNPKILKELGINPSVVKRLKEVKIHG